MKTNKIKDFISEHKKEIAIGTICAIGGYVLSHKFGGGSYTKTDNMVLNKLTVGDLGKLGEEYARNGIALSEQVDRIDVYLK